MCKETVMQEVLGKVLCPFGFVFEPDPEMGLWRFSRSVENKAGEQIRQEVCVQQSTSAQALYFRVGTNAYGQPPFWNANQFVPGCVSETFPCRSEEEFVARMQFFADSMERYGLSLLDRVSEPTAVDRPSELDHRIVYENHRQMSETLIGREGLSLDMAPAEWMTSTFNILQMMRGQTYSESKEVLMELASFWGELLEKNIEGTWEFDEHLKGVCVSHPQRSIQMDQKIPQVTIRTYVLSRMFLCFQRSNEERTPEEFFMIVRNVLI